MTALPTISVIMPSFNAAHYMARSLPPLIAMRARGEVLEVIVVDDCSTDPSNIEMAARLGARVIRMPKNGGPGAARNHAVREAQGDIIWLVDADVVAHDDAALKVRAIFQDPGVAAAFGSYDDRPPADNFASQYKNLVHRYYHQRAALESESFWAGCGAIRADVYRRLGGFDGSRYGRPSIEDIEFGARMREAGLRIRLEPKLLGSHLKQWTLKEVVRTDIFQRAIPWSRLMLSGRGPRNDLNVSGAERVRAVIAASFIGSLLLAPLALVSSFFGYLLLAATALVAIANFELFAFFAKVRSPVFALAATGWHQVYYVYSAGAYAFCVAEKMLGSKAAPATAR
jgi:glycosyltransferase involved in cell wall biosynthesis